jgi:hypothetical protein
MASKKENHMDNRAWFMQEDGRFPQTLYVMEDHDRNGPISIDFMKGTVFDPFAHKLSAIEISLGKAFNGEDFKALIYNVEPGKYSTKEYILQWDFLPNSSNIPLANERALKVLYEIAPGEFQEIPTQIILPSGEVLENYKLINVLNRVEGIDFENSVPKKRYIDNFDKTDLAHYETIFCKKGMLQSSENLARTKEMFTSLVIASNRLKEACKKNKIKGMVFQDAYGTRYKFID